MRKMSKKIKKRGLVEGFNAGGLQMLVTCAVWTSYTYPNATVYK